MIHSRLVNKNICSSRKEKQEKEEFFQKTLKFFERKQMAEILKNNDRFCIQSRFYRKHLRYYNRAMWEIIVLGRKQGHWMWYLLPTPPFIVNGTEIGSSVNRQMALRSDDEACEYLCYDTLRSNYVNLLLAIKKQLDKGKNIKEILGNADTPKLESSVKYFKYITEKYKAFPEVNAVCNAIIRKIC